MSRLTKDEVSQLYVNASEASKGGHLRIGQALMNELFKLNYILYNEVMASDCDPYYNDKKITDFIAFIQDDEPEYNDGTANQLFGS